MLIFFPNLSACLWLLLFPPLPSLQPAYNPDLLLVPLGQRLLIAERVRSSNLRLFTLIKLSAAVIYDALSKRGVDELQEDGKRQSHRLCSYF